ncbi:hypothetical protein [Fluviicola taffensis]|uniref:Short chain amide porin n=1 Tax=Fluviicola taffensis (strain DSM 16823 / NCIMB 13979 / RW262) TaxID=755732 RepID=F2IHD9_FLUTR|nr:hypothetical protein [Fluviicola taffensis]AEA42694.1 hypothetical protein Fluta_0690 [Fluviicola taffensis DSM 16823]
MKHLLLFGAISFCMSSVFGQGLPSYEGGLKVKLSEDGSKYIRFITWHQVYLKYNQNNDGSTLAGKPINESYDIALRRSRFLTYSQLGDRFLILTHFGINNQNTFSGGVSSVNGKKPQMFLHDAYVEYTVFKRFLNIGGGLHYWNGVSRMANTSTLNFLGQDAPIFNWYNIDKSDQFGRYLGVFAKGKIGKLDYRVSANDPFQANEAKAIATNVSDYNPYNRSWSTAGYFNYAFLEEESNLLPFMVGTYLGTKKVFNIGVGFDHWKDGMWHRNDAGDTVTQDQLQLGADVFLDMPLSKRKDAITFYGSYYNYNFGKDYVRHIGILNTADGGGALRGNALPTLGTGQIFFGQVGYLLPEFKMKTRFQVCGSFSHARFVGLRNAADNLVPVNTLDAGLNIYLAGHHSKVTLNYRARPDFTNIESVNYKNEVTIQLMVYL